MYWKKPLAKQNRKYPAQNHSIVQEDSVAKEFGGYTTIGSGNKGMKGDVRIPGVVRIENKATAAASFRVTREMMDKLKNHCIGYDELPIIQIDFIDNNRKILDQVAVIPYKLLESIIHVKTEQKLT